MSFSGLRGNALRIWGLAALVALAVFLVTRTVLLWHSVLFGEQSPAALIGPLVLGTLRDLPPAAVIASPWALFELLFSARWRARVRRPLFAIYVFTLLFVAVSKERALMRSMISTHTAARPRAPRSRQAGSAACAAATAAATSRCG